MATCIDGWPTLHPRSVVFLLLCAAGCGGGTEPSIDTLAITTGSLPNGAPAVPYDHVLSAVGGNGGYTWSVAAGLLPSGLSLTPDGRLAGTPTGSGASFTVEVASADGQSAEKSLSIVVNDTLRIVTDSLPAADPSATYSVRLASTGGDGTATWSVASGALPQGLELDATGLVAGTPTGTNSVVTVRAVGGDGQTAEREYGLSVLLRLLSQSIRSGGVGLAFGERLVAAGGDGAYTWSMTAGVLPNGLSLDNLTGVVEGTPTTPGEQGFNVRVESGDGQVSERSYSVRIHALLGTIEWPFAAPLDRPSVPTVFTGTLYYNGFYNDPPCENAETTLNAFDLEWDAVDFRHRYDAASDSLFAGFAACMVDGIDENLAMGFEGVTAWGVEESIAIDSGAPDLVGSEVVFVEFVADYVTVTAGGSGFLVDLAMRWLIFGS